MNRREMLSRGVAFVVAGAAMPAVFVRAVYAADNNGSAAATTGKNRTLVVLQMAGGNDGLNTVVPYADPQYYKFRANGLSIADTSVLKLNTRVGLHPSMTGMKAIWDRGQLGVVEGVGYPNANLSHFRSMQIWHSAEPAKLKSTGWLGEYLDATYSESNTEWRAVNVGSNQLPVSLLASGSFVPSIDSISGYQIRTDSSNSRDHSNKMRAWSAMYAQAAVQPGLMAFMGSAGSATYTSALDLQKYAAGYVPKATYPRSALGNALKLVAEIVTSTLGTGIAYVTTGGFDTHAGQPTDHTRLLGELSAAVAAFYADIEAQGALNNTVLMTWSEFGRRVQVNGSTGTDHGTAGPMFVMGGPVKGGTYGAPASLTSLDRDGNMKFTTDFRQVYATILEDWLQADAKEVLGSTFNKLGFIGPPAPPATPSTLGNRTFVGGLAN